MTASKPLPPSRRFDPYKNFKFRIKSEGRDVAGASGASDFATEAPGRWKYEPVTLDEGVTHDADFAAWAAGHGTPQPRDLTLELHDDTGHKLAGFVLQGAQPAAFAGAADAGGVIAIKALWLDCRHMGREDPDHPGTILPEDAI